MNFINDEASTLSTVIYDSVSSHFEETPNETRDQAVGAQANQDQTATPPTTSRDTAGGSIDTSIGANGTEPKPGKRDMRFILQRARESQEERKRLGLKRKSKSQKAGLIFPVDRVLSSFRKSFPSNKVRELAGVYLTAVLEYMSSEVLDLAGNCARARSLKRITLRDLRLAINADPELLKLLSNVTFPQAGVTPFVHPVLEKKLPKKVNKPKKPDTQAQVEERPSRKRKVRTEIEEEGEGVEQQEEQVEAHKTAAKKVRLSQEDLNALKKYIKLANTTDSTDSTNDDTTLSDSGKENAATATAAADAIASVSQPKSSKSGRQKSLEPRTSVETMSPSIIRASVEVPLDRGCESIRQNESVDNNPEESNLISLAQNLPQPTDLEIAPQDSFTNLFEGIFPQKSPNLEEIIVQAEHQEMDEGRKSSERLVVVRGQKVLVERSVNLKERKPESSSSKTKTRPDRRNEN